MRVRRLRPACILFLGVLADRMVRSRGGCPLRVCDRRRSSIRLTGSNCRAGGAVTTDGLTDPAEERLHPDCFIRRGAHQAAKHTCRQTRVAGSRMDRVTAPIARGFSLRYRPFCAALAWLAVLARTLYDRDTSDLGDQAPQSRRGRRVSRRWRRCAIRRTRDRTSTKPGEVRGGVVRSDTATLTPIEARRGSA